MSDQYPIVEVQPEWILQPEEMGSKKKFWYRLPGDQETLWLFKYPQSGTGQHWAEKIAEEVASVLRITHAKVELAQFDGECGSVTESFARGGRTLYHGNQVLQIIVHGYDPERRFHQSNHTLSNIWRALDNVFVEPETSRLAKLRIAEYVILDALIGNTDRHHENWGILRKRVGERWRGFVAPSFDHASSLGRELLDARRDRLLAENRVGNYAERGRGAVYWSEDEKHGPSPLDLVRRAIVHYPDFFRPALMKIEKFDEHLAAELVNRVPEPWMTPSARSFALSLLCYNLEQLTELI